MLDDKQKAQIRLYLGFPDYHRYKHTRLESVLNNLSAEAEELVAEQLAKIAVVDTALLDAGVTAAGIKRVDEIWFENGSKKASEVRKTGRQYVARLSMIVGVPINSDYFGTTGYSGDSFSGLGSPTNGGGRFYGLG